jgi:hypothetical protein
VRGRSRRVARARRPAYSRARGRQPTRTRYHRTHSRSRARGAHSPKDAEGALAAAHTPAARYRAQPCSNVRSTSCAISGTHARLAPRRGSPTAPGAIAPPPLLGRAHLTPETDSSASVSVHDGVRKPNKVSGIVERLSAGDRGRHLGSLDYQTIIIRHVCVSRTICGEARQGLEELNTEEAASHCSPLVASGCNRAAKMGVKLPLDMQISGASPTL